MASVELVALPASYVGLVALHAARALLVAVPASLMSDLVLQLCSRAAARYTC